LKTNIPQAEKEAFHQAEKRDGQFGTFLIYYAQLSRTQVNSNVFMGQTSNWIIDSVSCNPRQRGRLYRIEVLFLKQQRFPDFQLIRYQLPD